MTNETFEESLRAMLADRDPGPAPARLEALIRERVASDRVRRPATRLLQLAVPAASLAAVAALLVLALVMVRPTATGPGAGPASAPEIYVLTPGDGVVDAATLPIVQIVAWALVLVGLWRLAGRARSRWLTIATTLAVVGWIWVAANAGNSDALVQQSGVFAALPQSERQPDTSSMFVGVDGDQPFHVVVTVTNASRLPLVLRGLASNERVEVQDPPLLPRFVALGVLPPSDTRLEAVQRFAPVTVAAGGSVDLDILGMAGSCALAAPPANRIGGGFTKLDSVNLMYEQLTIAHAQSVTLSYTVNIWWPDECT